MFYETFFPLSSVPPCFENVSVILPLMSLLFLFYQYALFQSQKFSPLLFSRTMMLLI